MVHDSIPVFSVAEGFERGSRSEFYQFLVIAKASAAGVCSQLYIALDADYLDQPNFDNLMNQATDVSKINGGLRASVQRQRDAK